MILSMFVRLRYRIESIIISCVKRTSQCGGVFPFIG